jgi:TolB-like protein
MPGIIKGYNYDIFISYRQKDNKNDGWVTEFVDLLKKELEAIFKEEISVYFDENPGDGLLETHIVDESLSEKLKCLIFIPVLSQTYCDPQSFAWKHEFCAFNKLAKGDRFGRDIKLPGGNVASRILPVKIRDLDPEDKNLLENEIGGALRCVEFVYMSAGVNRPLRASEDHPQDNLNRIYYRDQINKVANAIKEILSALKTSALKESALKESALKKDSHEEDELKQQEPEIKPLKQNNYRNRIITGSLIVLLLFIAGLFFLPGLFKPEDQPDRSIAVLPFEVWNSESGTEYLGSAIANEICTQLSLIKGFQVKSYTSSSRYMGPDKPSMQNIGRELGANYIIEGSIERQFEDVSIHVQVILAQEDDHIWAREFKGEWADIFKIRADISKMLAEELEISLSPEEKELIEKIPTASLAAYDVFQRGNEQYINYLNNPNDFEALEKAKDYLRRALELDHEYAQVYARLAGIYFIENRMSNEFFGKNYLDSARYFAEKALKYDNETSEALVVMGDYYRENGNLEQALKEYNAAL